MSENYEVMEAVAVEETEEIEGYEIEEGEAKAGFNAGLAAGIIGGALALGGLAIVGVKKLKKKRAEKQADKPKTKLKLFVRVPVEEQVEAVEETVAEEADED